MEPPSSPERLRIGAAISDPVRVEGFRAFLSDIADLVPVTPNDAVRDAELDIVIIDAGEEILALIDAFRRARPSLRLLVLGQNEEPKYIGEVVAAGAKGYLSQRSSSREIRMAVEVIADGSIWAPRRVLATLLDSYAPASNKRVELRFTPRETELLNHLAEGQSDREIARQLGVSPRTAQNMVANLMRKVGVRTRVALATAYLSRTGV